MIGLNRTQGTTVSEPGLLIRELDGSVIQQIPSDVLLSLRHMVTRLTRDQALASRLALVAGLRGEGVTYNSLALGAVLTNDTDCRTCVVDLNWCWPSQSFTSPGIAGILAEQADIEQSLVVTNNPRLSILPAGRFAAGQRAIVARSSALATLITELGTRFDHLVLDIPAILTTSDAIPLASLAEQVCVVAQYGATPTTVVAQALDEISHLPIAGVLINKVQIAMPTWLLKWIRQA